MTAPSWGQNLILYDSFEKYLYTSSRSEGQIIAGYHIRLWGAIFEVLGPIFLLEHFERLSKFVDEEKTFFWLQSVLTVIFILLFFT